ncbi:MAG: transglycosylase domain-containing protein [Clostridia bacterium]|nr:transglycosylase domain-containing protein [Clostridia bacterium]
MSYYQNDNFNNKETSIDLNSFSEKAKKATTPSKKSSKSNGPKRSKLVTGILALFLTFVILGSFLVGGFLYYAFYVVDSSMDVDLDNLELNYTTTIYAKEQGSSEFVEYQRLHGKDNRIWIDDENGNMPKNLKNAFIAVEDKTFRDHKGVNWKRTFSAFLNLFFKFYSSNQGGSTITQQLVKNITMDDEAGGIEGANRKIREIMRARELEEQYSKDTILECYLNTIAMGGGMYGVEVASNYYFDKSAKDLNLVECAALAAIAKSPEDYRPDKNPKANKERRQTVLNLMLEQGIITEKQHKKAYDADLKIAANKENLNEVEINSYYTDLLINDVVKDLMAQYGYTETEAYNQFYTKGYKVYATVIPKIQSALDKTFTSSKYKIKNADGDYLQGSMTVMDYKGHIVGMVGGIGEKSKNLSFNRATSAVRQPGSTMKPMSAYAPAIENNLITYSTIVNDKETYYGKWKPNNWYSDKYRGQITIEYALRISANTIPVMLVDQLTTQSSYNFLVEKFGLKNLTKEDINYSPLGMGGTNGGVTTLEEAAAYAAFGNGGFYYEPITYYKVTDQNGNTVLTNESKAKVALSEDTATVMNKLLQNVVYGAEGTAAGMGSTVSNMKIFAKTGTSNENSNSWFTGGTPYYVASAWCGFDEYKPLTMSQASTSKQLWREVMSAAHKGLKVKKFNDSSDVVSRKFCRTSGLIATSNCTSTSTGWYKKSNVPTTCTIHPSSASNTAK